MKSEKLQSGVEKYVESSTARYEIEVVREVQTNEDSATLKLLRPKVSWI